MAQLNSDVNNSWGGYDNVPAKSGQEVQDIIKAQFQSNIDSINNSISGLQFSEHLDDYGNPEAGKVDYTITKNDGTQVTNTFSLVAPTTDKVYLDSFTVPQYVPVGSSATITYSFHITSNDVQVSGKKADIQLTITNGSYVKRLDPFKTNTSYANSNRSGSYEIPGSYLREGNNVISIVISYVTNEGAATLGDTDVEREQSILSFNLKASATLSNNMKLSKIVADPAVDTFGIQMRFVDGLGKNLSYLPQDIVITTRIINSNGAVSNSFTGTSANNLTLQSISGNSANYVYIFYLQSQITIGGNTIYSNVIKYQFIGGSNISGNLTKFAYCIPEYSNYTNGTVNTTANYFVADQYSTIEIPIYAFIPVEKVLTYSVNGETVTTISNLPVSTTELTLVSGDRVTPWNYQVTQPTSNIIVVSDGTQSVTFNITTNNISNDLSLPNDYVVRLTANGKTGKDEVWGLDANDQSLTKFTNFDWSSNGWFDGALVVNGGATATINITPCSKIIGNTSNSSTVTGRSVSFRFKTVNENTDEELITCYTSNKDGFKIYPQRATLFKGTQQTSTTFTSEDSIKEVTFVWYNTEYGNVSIIYVNGTSQMVLTSGTSAANSSKIIISANHTTLYLYNVETYEKALTFSEVQALYALHKASGIADYITANAIFNDSITLGNNGQKVTIDNLPVGSRYLLIKAHPLGESRFWEKINNLDATKDINGKTKETKSWRLLVGNMYLITKTADGSGVASNFFANRGTLSGQGTSSMSYPIKNFRIYFAKKITSAADTGNQSGFGDCYEFTDTNDTNWTDGEFGKTTVFLQSADVTGPDYVTETGNSNIVYTMHQDSIPANVFCLKADYAESSGMHNTGFAKLSNYLIENSTPIYNGESSKLPMNEDAYKNGSPYTCRSTIDGFQIYLFFEDKEGNVVYHGKYNFNNEKSSPEVFGFQPYSTKLKYGSYLEYGNDPSKIKGKAQTTSYFDNEIVKNECALLKSLFGLSNNDHSYENGHMMYRDQNENAFVNPMECWEFSTNDAGDIEHRALLGNYLSQIGAFTFPYTSENGHSVSGYPYSGVGAYSNLNPFTENYMKNNQAAGLAWINTEQAWEPRFPDEDDISDFYENGGTPYLLRSVYKWVHKHNVYCWSADNKPEHAAIFAQDLHKYFNVNYLVKYYVLTKLFINADQRIKNCMLAFYCDPAVESNTDPDTPTGHMRGYYIFYDNDTILGVDNTGSLSNSWNADEKFGTFQGIDNNNVSFHGLWGNLEYCYDAYINGTYSTQSVYNLGKLIEDAYKNLRNLASDATIAEYLYSNLPDAADNIDAEVKYFFTSTLAPEKAENFAAGNIQQYQGNRKYHREWLLNKRTKWFDAKYGAGTVNDYKFNFKFKATSGLFEGSTLKFYSAFNNWKFYWQGGDSGALIPTALVQKYDFTSATENNYGTLTCASTVNSNVYHIKGLYGVNKIDLSGWYGNTQNNFLFSINNVSGYNPLPYLKEFIIGNLDHPFYVTNEGFSSFFMLGSKVLTPNLESLTIQNITGVGILQGSTEENYTTYTSTINLDLSKLIKLRTIDTTNTLCSLTLPSGSALQTLILKSATELTFEDKVNLNSLTIADTTELSNITVRHSSNYLYLWALNFLLSSTDTDLTIVFGNGSDKDNISDATVTALVNVARGIRNNTFSGTVNISGIAYNANITSEQINTLYTVFGSDLSISNIDTSEFEITLNEGNVLLEGGELHITPSQAVDIENGALTYDIEYVSGNDVLFSNITIDTENSSPYLCIIKANTIDDNINRTCTVKVSARHNGTVAESDDIIVNCVSIGQFTLSMPNATNNIISSMTTVGINLGNESTKRHLLTSQSQNVQITATSGTCSSLTNDGTFTFTPVENTDSIITVTIFDRTATLNAFYDVKVCDINQNSGTDVPELLWINDIFTGLFYKFTNNRIMRSDLSNLTATTNGTSITITGALGSDTIAKTIASVEENTYDLSAIAFFRTDTLFRIPSGIKFTNLSIPEGAANIEWSNIVQSYSGYGTITFPSTTNKVCITLNNLETTSANLKFDISKTNIRKIYNTGSASTSNMTNLDNTFSLSLTVSQSAQFYKDNVLFTYNNVIEQIGYYSETIGNTVSAVPSAMFNVTEATINSQYNPIYSFGSPTSIKYVGFISSYRMIAEAIRWNTIQAYVKGLYFTFYNGSGVPGNQSLAPLTFSQLEFIGDASFYGILSGVLPNVYIGNRVKKIGCAAFEGFLGQIQESTSISNVNLNALEIVGTRGLNSLDQNHIFNIGQVNNPVTLSEIQSYAFSVSENKSHTINLYTETPITTIGAEYPFGTSNRNVINLYTSSSEVVAQFRNYVNQVTIYLNGSSTPLTAE